MRHRYSGKYLNRDTSHRMAMIKNMATSLINHGSIETTLAKAKTVQPYVEKLVTRARNPKGHNTVKFLQSKLASDESVRNLLEKVAPTQQNRNGGYTKITKLPNRVGDNSLMARIEFVKVETKAPAKKAKKAEKAVESKVETETKVEE